jgi:hypothetical protein
VIIGKLIPAGSGMFARNRRPDPVAALLGGSADSASFDQALPLDGASPDGDALAFAEEEVGGSNVLIDVGDDISFSDGDDLVDSE